MKDKEIIKSGPTIFQQIIVPFIISSFMVITALQASNYFSQKSLKTQELKDRFSDSLADVSAYFNATYNSPIQNDLKFIENSYAFNSFLSSQKNEILLTKPLAERLFLHFTDREEGIYLSLRFVDAKGVEKVVTEGNKRKREYVSLAAAPRDALHEGITALFSKLKSKPPGAISCEDPFEYQGKWTFLAGMAKSEPEIGGVAGVVIFHCDLAQFFSYLAGYEFYGEHVATATSLDYKLMFSSTSYGSVIGFGRDLEGKQKYRDFYHLTKEIKIDPNDQALFNVVFRISPKMFQKETKNILTSSLLFLFLAFFLIGVTVLKVSKKLTRSLMILMGAIKQFAQGDLSARAHVKTTGEVQLLAEAFNRMAGDLDKTTVSRDSLIQEVNDRRQVEAALRETKEYLESLIAYANAPIIVWDPQLRITRFNHAFEVLTGRDAPSVIGRTPDIFLPPDQAERSMELIRKTQSGERWEWIEINIQHVDGSVHNLFWNSAVIFAPDGKTPLAIIAQGYDITERKKAEEALYASEVKYRNIVEMTGTGYLVLDAQGRVLDANQQYVRLSGHGDLRDILGKSVMEWTAEEAKRRNEEAIVQCVKDRFIKNCIVEYTDGKSGITTVEINAIVEGEGESLRIVSLCRDITERVKAEEKEKKQLKTLDVFYKASIGREERVIELKKEIEQLRKELGK